MTKQLTDLTQMFVQTVERLTNETEKRKDTRMSKESSDLDGSKRSKDNGHRNEKSLDVTDMMVERRKVRTAMRSEKVK